MHGRLQIKQYSCRGINDSPKEDNCVSNYELRPRKDPNSSIHKNLSESGARSGGMKVYHWMKNVNWRKTGLKLGDTMGAWKRVCIESGVGRGLHCRGIWEIWWGYPGGVWKLLENFWKSLRKSDCTFFPTPLTVQLYPLHSF